MKKISFIDKSWFLRLKLLKKDLNKFLEKKVTITANKSQTTRSNIYAIKTLKTTQIIFIDTPGIHKKSEKTINKVLRKKPAEVIHDVDVIIFMVSGTNLMQSIKKA